MYRSWAVAASVISVLWLHLFVLSPQVKADVERYMALPLGGGYVFILDTREGHAWTWTSSIPGDAKKNGVNPKLTYQGNVRQNMQPRKPQANIPQPPVPPSQSQRF